MNLQNMKQKHGQICEKKMKTISTYLRFLQAAHLHNSQRGGSNFSKNENLKNLVSRSPINVKQYKQSVKYIENRILGSSETLGKLKL